MLSSKFCGWSLGSVLALAGGSLCRAQTSSADVTSPDHRIAVRFAVQPKKDQGAGQDGQLVYSISFKGKPAFEESALRLELADQPPLGATVHIASATPASASDDYSLVASKVSAVHDAYNSLRVHVAEGAKPGREFDIEL